MSRTLMTTISLACLAIGMTALPAGVSGPGGGGDLPHEGFDVAGGHLVQPQMA